MKIVSAYSVKIKHYNHIFKDTVSVYRDAVDFLIDLCLKEWNGISVLKGVLQKKQYIEQLCHKTADNPVIKYSDFDRLFYKFPSYLRRSAISSGIVERGVNGNYSICRFQDGKTYHCDLSASYNIGARYFVREIIKSLPETERLRTGAKVPQCVRRSTCTFSTLISLNAELMSA